VKNTGPGRGDALPALGAVCRLLPERLSRAIGSAGRAGYPARMLRILRSPRGGPAASTRLLAAMLVVGMVAAAAPSVIPAARWVVAKVADNIV
jgi:hypothetical protein